MVTLSDSQDDRGIEPLMKCTFVKYLSLSVILSLSVSLSLSLSLSISLSLCEKFGQPLPLSFSSLPLSLLSLQLMSPLPALTDTDPWPDPWAPSLSMYCNQPPHPVSTK